MQARWLHDQRRDSEIGPKVESLAGRLSSKLPQDAQKRAAAEAQLSLEVGNIYTAAEQHAAAERWYRRLLKAGSPAICPAGRVAGAAESPGRGGGRVSRGGEDRPFRAAGDDSRRRAQRLRSRAAEEFRRAEPLLAESLASHPKDADLLSAVAGVRVLQQRTDEAIELYRRVVSLKPKDVLALNNLATLLAEQPHTRKEALRSIDQAIGLAGRLPPLLDTKGTILVHEGKAEEAVPLLRGGYVGGERGPAVFLPPRFGLPTGGQARRGPRSPAKGPRTAICRNRCSLPSIVGCSKSWNRNLACNTRSVT